MTFNTLRPRQNGRRFADDTFRRIFLNENVWISIEISLKFVPKGPINNIPALVQIMAWRRSGDKPLSEPMMISLLTHICVTRPQWVNKSWFICTYRMPSVPKCIFAQSEEHNKQKGTGEIIYVRTQKGGLTQKEKKQVKSKWSWTHVSLIYKSGLQQWK